MKICKYCGSYIDFVQSQADGRWTPINLSYTIHRCKEKENPDYNETI
jgi:hypothetical protein